MHEQRAWRPVGHRYLDSPDSRLHGTGLLGDDLYLMAHDDRTGRPLLSPRPLGTGLAGALLAELMVAGFVRLLPDVAVVIRDHVPRTAVDGHAVLKLIDAEPEPLPVRDWLRFLSRTAARDVGLRLERAGYLTRAGSRLLGRSRMVPTNPNAAHMPVLRALSALDPGREIATYTAALAGLATGCGLGFRLEQNQTRAGRTVTQAVACLNPDLRVLITQIQINVCAAVLSHRT